MAIEQQQDDSQEGLRRKRLRELASQQQQNMSSSVPEQGIEEVSPRKSAIRTLKEANFPMAAKVADSILPNEPESLGDVAGLLPVGRTLKAAEKMIPQSVKDRLMKTWYSMSGKEREGIDVKKWMQEQAGKEMTTKSSPGKMENVGSKKYQSAKVEQERGQKRLQDRLAGEEALLQKRNQVQQPVRSEAPTQEKQMDSKAWLDSLTDLSGAESGQQYNKQKKLKKGGY